MVLKFKLRLYFLTLIMVAGFCALLARLWVIQVKRHHEFVELVPGTSTVSQRVPSVRGEIKDRNGIVLATNRALLCHPTPRFTLELLLRRRWLLRGNDWR